MTVKLNTFAAQKVKQHFIIDKHIPDNDLGIKILKYMQLIFWKHNKQQWLLGT